MFQSKLGLLLFLIQFGIPSTTLLRGETPGSDDESIRKQVISFVRFNFAEAGGQSAFDVLVSSSDGIAEYRSDLQFDWGDVTPIAGELVRCRCDLELGVVQIVGKRYVLGQAGPEQITIWKGSTVAARVLGIEDLNSLGSERHFSILNQAQFGDFRLRFFSETVVPLGNQESVKQELLQLIDQAFDFEEQEANGTVVFKWKGSGPVRSDERFTQMQMVFDRDELFPKRVVEIEVKRAARASETTYEAELFYGDDGAFMHTGYRVEVQRFEENGENKIRAIRRTFEDSVRTMEPTWSGKEDFYLPLETPADVQDFIQIK